MVHRQRMFAQCGQRVVMACVQREHMRAVVKSHREGALEFCTQRLDLRLQSRLGLALRPHQLATKLAQARRLAFFPQHKPVAQFALPALEFTPDMAVGKAKRARSA